MRSSNSFMFCCYAISNGSKTNLATIWQPFGNPVCFVAMLFRMVPKRSLALILLSHSFVAMLFRMVPKPRNVLKRTKQLINVFKLL